MRPLSPARCCSRLVGGRQHNAAFSSAMSHSGRVVRINKALEENKFVFTLK